MTKFGIFNFGFIRNKNTYKNELEELTTNEIDINEFNKEFFNAKTKNKLIYKDQYGNIVEEKNAYYALYQTKYTTKNGDGILCLFDRNRTDKNWSGVIFLTLDEFGELVIERLKFRIGKISFDNWKDGLGFLEELKNTAIPENWTYKHHPSSIPHPILKSYLENIIEKILSSKSENSLLFSDKKDMVIFNTGLLDKFFHAIFLICYVEEQKNNLILKNPFIMKSLTDLSKVKFIKGGSVLNKPEMLPKVVSFFENVNQVIFQPSYPIDRNYEKFTHIIEERLDRFPKEYQDKDKTHLARLLDNSINYAIEIAKRNYKLVVPQYRPQDDKIQLLMPIYLDGQFSKTPDFALVLNREDDIYIPETILPLDAAYQNARVIAKPDEFWLNPEDI